MVNSSALSVVHTSGKSDKPEIIHKNTWFNDYPKTIVIRPNNSTKGQQAAEWAQKIIMV